MPRRPIAGPRALSILLGVFLAPACEGQSEPAEEGSKSVCSALTEVIQRCPEEYCGSKLNLDALEVATCEAFVVGVQASDPSSAEAVSCNEALASCSESVQARLRDCATCVSDLDCSTPDLGGMLFSIASDRLPMGIETCGFSCSGWKDIASDSCVNAVHAAHAAWLKAMWSPGCEELKGSLGGVSCDFDLTCDVTCVCLDGPIGGDASLTVECTSRPPCDSPDIQEICSERCEEDTFKSYGMDCPAPSVGARF